MDKTLTSPACLGTPPRRKATAPRPYRRILSSAFLSWSLWEGRSFEDFMTSFDFLDSKSLCSALVIVFYFFLLPYTGLALTATVHWATEARTLASNEYLSEAGIMTFCVPTLLFRRCPSSYTRAYSFITQSLHHRHASLSGILIRPLKLLRRGKWHQACDREVRLTRFS